MTVEVMAAQPKDVPVIITGFGEARSLNVVQLAAEVAGKVVEIHPRLEVGEMIPKGELLFRIDPTDYSSSLEAARAQVAQSEASIARIKKQQSTDTERLETLRRTRTLAEGEFQRIKELLEKDQVGTRSGVDAAEMQLNQTKNAYDQLSQMLEIYPASLREAESALAAAKAQADMASTSLARTEVHAPFDARLSRVALEAGQYVRPGEVILELSDDSVLELSVPLDSRDARRWLQFRQGAEAGSDAWFGNLEQVPCRIFWTEDPEQHAWQGTLHRVEQFDEQTRTVTVAVRVPREASVAQSGDLPLVAGMFCGVEIPGKTMEQVYELPRWAVSYEGKVYLSDDKRLAVRDVEVLRTQGEKTFVSGGLQPGDQIVVTRLVNPLPNSLLDPQPAGVVPPADAPAEAAS